MHYEHCNVGYNKHKSFPLAWSRFLQTLCQCTSSHEGGTQTYTHHHHHSGEGSRQQVCEVHQAHEQLLHPAPPILRGFLRGYLLHPPLEDTDVYNCCVNTFHFNNCIMASDTDRFHISVHREEYESVCPI